MTDRFLDWFERHKFGVVGTLMLHTFLMFFFAMGKLGGLAEQEVAPPDLELELAEPMELPDQELVQSPQMQATEVKNLTGGSVGETQEFQPSLSRGAQERMASHVEEDLRAFEQAEFDRLAQERALRGEDVVVPQLDSSKWRKELYMPQQRKPVKAEGNTTVRYELPPRIHEILEVPAYLCKGQGRVVIRITVDRNGRVGKAELDAAATTTTDACMVDNALSSAQQAKFNQSSDAPDPQRGTITYTFLAQ
jgi:hypothetical protein